MKKKSGGAMRKLCVAAILCMVFAAAAALSGCYSYEDVLRYLGGFDRPNDFAVSDGGVVFCLDNTTVDLQKRSSLENIEKVAWIDSNYVYIVCRDAGYDDNRVRIVFRADHALLKTERLFTFTSGMTYRFLDEDLLYYEFGEVAYTYRLSTGKTDTVEDTYPVRYAKEHNRYTVSRTANAHGEGEVRFFVSDNVTGEEKTVGRSDLLQTEQGKYLDGKRAFSPYTCCAHGEDVFLIARSGDVSVVFQYDFSGGTVRYYSWIDDARFLGDTREFYFF